LRKSKLSELYKNLWDNWNPTNSTKGNSKLRSQPVNINQLATSSLTPLED